MNEDKVLVKLDTARFALEEAKTIQDTKRVFDAANATLIFAKRQKAGKEIELQVTSFMVDALRQLGNMLKETPRNKGASGVMPITGNKRVPVMDDTPTLAELGLDKRTSKLAQDIAKLPDEQIEKIKTGVMTIAKAQSAPHVSHNSGENEWYTPAEYIDSARLVMGGIDTDPASSEKANVVVEADVFYTKEDDGLSKPWSGRVWMNPPYESGLISKFSEKLQHHVVNNQVTDAIILVNNATETNWFMQIISVASAVVFPNKRIKFLDPEGNPGAPLQGQAIIYIGKDEDKFLNEFLKFGWGCKCAE